MKNKLFLSMLICFVLLLAIPLSVSADSSDSSDYVAEVNGTKYETLREAVENAPNDSVVTVIKSHTITCNSADDTMTVGNKYNTIICVAGKNITVDLNGMHVTCDLNADLNGSTGLLGLFSVESVDDGEGNPIKSHLILKDSSEAQTGTLELITEKDDEPGSHHKAYTMLLCYDANSKLTVESGNYILDATYSGRGMVYANTSTECVYIKGGNFTLGNVGSLINENNSPWIFAVSGSNTGHILVSGGTFNDDILNQHWIFEVQTDGTVALRDNGDGTYTFVPAVAYVNEQHKSGKWYSYLRGYATIEEAIAATNTTPPTESESSSNKKPEEIFVVRDIDITGELTIPEDIVINLDTEGADLNVYGKLVNNGTIVSNAEKPGSVNIVKDIIIGDDNISTTLGSFSGNEPTGNVGPAANVFTTDQTHYYKDDANGQGGVISLKDDTPISMHLSIKEAYEVDESNGILLLQDVTEPGFKIEKDITIDLGGNTYSLSDNASEINGDKIGLFIANNGTAVLKNGKLNIAKNVASHVDIDTLICSSGKLEIADTDIDSTGSLNTVTVKNGTTNITDNVNITAGDNSAALDIIGGNTSINTKGIVLGKVAVGENGILKISGGTYSADIQKYLASGYHALSTSEGLYNVQPHDLKKTDPTPADCENNGNIEYWHCAGCGKYYSDADAQNELSKSDLIVSKKDHDYINGVCGCGAKDPDYLNKNDQADNTDNTDNTETTPNDDQEKDYVTQTGDNNNIAIWFILTAAAFAALIAVLLLKKKNPAK